MNTTDKAGTTLYHFENLSAEPSIRHYVSTRKGGFSRKPFCGLNIGFHVGDDNFSVLQNRRQLSQAAGLNLMCCTFAQQDHTANIAIIDRKSRGRGADDWESAIPNTDGMITNVENICLNVQVADCVPILLYDPRQRVIAALHAGWKGTLKRIAPHAIEMMIQQYGCKAENILAGLGPSNGPCCYEVGEDVKRETLMAFGSTHQVILPGKTPGKYIFDQWQANKMQLLEYGLKEEHIELSGLCSQCHHDTFFSSRADHGTTGRIAAGIMLCRH
ncbi:MAG: peptidoglycan editing factor PgeF [Bacteroidales bacterium]